MEGISTAVYRGIRGYWRRKGYERLTGGRKRKVRVVRLASDGGDGPARRRRFWRIKLSPRLRLSEYDERMIVEIYKSIVVAQGQLVPRDAAWVGSEITCRR
ncbi:Unknown protein [Striga hermonthica]|uniref:Uncharacterized protein n=1 Tax=Striga hermonthica TaxID=68872 RepID=A0A9N7RFF8_STRHE|nr:Unknown protein [Striga hermonthica]